MPSRKKKFIDKKHAVTFHLVHRSQQDPESANDEAPQGVLVPSSRKEEQLKYGIEFDDDYNYLQHLRDVDELYNVEADVFRVGISSSEALLKADPSKKSSLIFPSNVFASPVETTVGVLNRAASSNPEEMDDEITAALEREEMEGDDDDFEDDFIVQLNGGTSKDEGDDIDEYVDSDVMGDMDDFEEDEEEEEGVSKGGKKVTFRIGSIHIPEARKGTHLEAIDDKFAKMYEKFKNNEDCDEAEDDEFMDSDDGLDDDDVSKHLTNQFTEMTTEDLDFDPKIDEDLKNKIMECVAEDNSEDEMVKIKVEVPVKHWDCESILSLRSNTSHLPKTIHLPKKPTRVVTFAEPVVENGPEMQNIEDEKEENETKTHMKPLVIPRNKNESKDEKKARKNAIKEDKRVRRLEKSQKKSFFAHEKERMAKQMIHQADNFQGSSILP